MLNVAISLIPNTLKKTTTIYLIIDDTLQAKFGEKFDCYKKLFDHIVAADIVIIIGALRSNTAMFDLNIEKTHKRGRPRKRGKRIDYHNLKYKKKVNSLLLT